MRPLLVTVRENEPLANPLAEMTGAEQARLEVRRFPDGETYLRYDTDPAGRSIILLCGLDRPDDKLLPVLFAIATARDLGASSVGLVCPYLAYMRQDRRFKRGEALTSAYFAGIFARRIDWLVTVDPHLHRQRSLAEVYSIPASSLHAAPLIADWIRKTIDRPLLIGPDVESEQWVSAVARDAGAPYLVLRKDRRGDRDVEVLVPDVGQWRDHTPVLVDDIISTGQTMIETIGHLSRSDLRSPVCVAVHGLFAGNAYQDLVKSGVARIVTSNTVAHESNEIDVTRLLAEGIGRMINGGAT